MTVYIVLYAFLTALFPHEAYLRSIIKGRATPVYVIHSLQGQSFFMTIHGFDASWGIPELHCMGRVTFHYYLKRFHTLR